MKGLCVATKYYTSIVHTLMHSLHDDEASP